MSCMCYCHDLAMQMYPTKFMSAYAGCPNCDDAHAPLPTKTPKVTGENLHTIVESISEYPEPHFSATRYTLHFYTYSGMTPLKFGVKIANELLATTQVSVKDLLAIELNRWFKEHPNDFLPWMQQALMGTGGPLTTGKTWYEGHHVWPKGGYDAVDGDTVVRDLRRWLPGLSEAVLCPAQTQERPPGCTCAEGTYCTCDPYYTGPCGRSDTVQHMIVHLNDKHRWDRNRTADWLESLDVDLTFGAEPPPPPRLLPKAKRGEKLVIIGQTLKAAEDEAKRRGRGPKEVELASAHQGHGRIIERLRGRRGFQYVILPGTYISDEVQALLEYSEAVQVGEEEPLLAGSTTMLKIQDEMNNMLLDFVAGKPQETVYVDAQSATTDGKDAYTLSMWAKTEGSSWEKLQKTIQLDEYWKAATAKPSDFVTMEHLYQMTTYMDPWPDDTEPVDPKTKALDAKKKNAHTAFTVNPTKKNPFKKN